MVSLLSTVSPLTPHPVLQGVLVALIFQNYQQTKTPLKQGLEIHMQLNNTFVLCLYNSAAKCKGLCVKVAVYLDKRARLCNELPKENQADSCSKGLVREYLH